MKKRKLRREVKQILVLAVLFAVAFISISRNINNVSKDELGNICRGGIVKVCEN